MTTETVGCVKAATQILGDKWTPQLIRFFANEESIRFGKIQDTVTGINPRTLSARLTTLECAGVITKTPTSNSSRCEYSLTEKGKALIPILRAMEQWGEKYKHQPCG